MEFDDELMSQWEKFCIDDTEMDTESDNESTTSKNNEESLTIHTDNEREIIPKCTSLYISTKTKICYLNKEIDLKNVFWEIPIIPYQTPSIGVVKKQMKFNSTKQE